MSKSTLCVYERVFQSLICKQCAETVKGRKLSGMNILMCSHKEHSKPTPDEVAPILQQLIGFDKGNKGSLVLSCIEQLCPNPLVGQVSKSRSDYSPLESAGQTYFDTVTGEVKAVVPGKSLSDPGERAFQSCKN